jgi:hypothetical protein
MDSDTVLYVLFGLNISWWLACLVYGLLSRFYDRAYDRGWTAACEAFGLDAGSGEICD